MAYTPTNWIDGVTPVSAANLNNLEGGVNDLTDTGILDKKIVSESSTNARIIAGQISINSSESFTANNYGVIFACCGAANFAAYFWRSGNVVTLFQTGSQIEREVDGYTLTVTMNGSYAAIRYIAIIS